MENIDAIIITQLTERNSAERRFTEKLIRGDINARLSIYKISNSRQTGGF